MSENDVSRRDKQLVESPNEASSTNAIQAEISTLESILRKPTPDTSYSNDQECQRIVHMVERIGVDNAETGADAHSPSSEIPCERLGHYELLKKLGEGGMGAVYKARHVKLNKLVALKVLPADRLKDQQAVTRFEREMRAVGQLSHANIVAAHDAGEIDGSHYLVMELVDGIDLSTLVRQCGTMPIAEACKVICLAAQGLQYAHSSGMVHRDIKPGNLMLTSDGEIKILDMGLALLDEMKNADKGELTTTGQMMGTLDYMAPEQGVNSHKVDIRADVYSLGATLFKLLTGEAPFHGPQYETPVSRMMALAVETPRTLCDVRDDIPKPLSEIVARLLAKNPDDRPATPQHVADLLTPFAEGAQLKEIATLAREKVNDEVVAPSDDTFAHLRSSFTDTCPTTPAAVLKVERRPHGARGKWWVAGASIAGAVFLTVILTLRTEKGTIIVKVPDGEESNVQLAVSRDGKTVDVLDADKGWTIRVEEGVYQINVKRGGDRFVVSDNKLTVERGEEERVTVSMIPTKVNDSGDSPQEANSPGDAGSAPNVAASSAFRIRNLAVFPHADQMRFAWISNDGNAIVTSDRTNAVKLYDVVIRKLRAEIKAPSAVAYNARFSPDSKTLAIVSPEGQVELWAVDSGKRRCVIDTGVSGHASIAFSPDSKTLATTNKGGGVSVWKAFDGEVQTSFGKGWGVVGPMVFGDDGDVLAFACGDRTILVRDLANDKHLHTLSGQGGDLRLANDARELWLVDGTRTYRWNLRKDPQAKTIAGRVLSPRRSWTATVNGNDPTVHVVHIASGKKIQFTGSHTKIHRIAFSSNDRILVTGDHRGNISFWNPATGKPIANSVNHGGWINTLSFSKDARFLVSSSWDRRVGVWEIVPVSKAESTVNLAAVEPISATAGFRGFHATTTGKGPLLRPDLKVATEYLYASAPSRVRYAVPEGMKSFTAVAFSPTIWTVGFKVMAGDTTVYEKAKAWDTVRLDLPKDTTHVDLVFDWIHSKDRGSAFWIAPRFHPVSVSEVKDLFGDEGKHVSVTNLKPVEVSENVTLSRNRVPEDVAPPVELDFGYKVVGNIPEGAPEQCKEFLYANPDSRVEYKIPKGATAFTAVGHGHNGRLHFEVHVDDRLLYRSPQAGIVPIDVKLPNDGNVLALVISGSGFRSESRWCYPRIHIGGSP